MMFTQITQPILAKGDADEVVVTIHTGDCLVQIIIARADAETLDNILIRSKMNVLKVIGFAS